MRTALVFMLASLPVCGQFAELATTDDGRVTYFTSTLQLQGAAPSLPERRIFRVSDAGVELFAERGALANTTAFGSGDGAFGPQVSSDGSTIGLTMRDICESPQGCSTSITRAEVRGAHTAVLGNGTLAMSRNARWAVLTEGSPVPGETQTSTFIDLESGQRTLLPAAAAGTWQVASDGTVLLQGPPSLRLWKQGTLTPVSLQDATLIYGISDNAGVVVYSQFTHPPDKFEDRLVVKNLSSGADAVVLARVLFPKLIVPMGLSNNGRWLLYRVTENSLAGVAYVADTTTGESTAIALEGGELVGDGTISGNGTVIVLVTAKGRMLTMDRATGSKGRTLIPSTAYVPSLFAFAPGSLVHLAGTLPADPAELTGRILIDDIPVPVVYATEGDVAVQVPWEARAPSRSAFRLDVKSDSPFRQNEEVTIMPMSPRFEQAAPGEASVLGFKAVRGDFSGLLTSQPHPGDVFIVYATGLGRVIGDVKTGEPAPLDRLLPIQGRFTCRFTPYDSDAETLFAGLAPGLIGIYQINFRLPQQPDPGPITGGECRWDGGVFGWLMLSHP